MARHLVFTTLTWACAVMGLGRAVVADGHAKKDKPKFEVIDPDGIYFGKGSHPKAPAVIVADSVWAEIPEYKKIVKDELGEDDPKYHILMKKASARFSKALKKAAKRGGHDVIGESGSIEAKGEKKAKIPDITDDLIDLVSRD